MRLGNAFKAREGSRFGPEGLHLETDGKRQGAVLWRVAQPDLAGDRADARLGLDSLREE
jgi:hypothetical protein